MQQSDSGFFSLFFLEIFSIFTHFIFYFFILFFQISIRMSNSFDERFGRDGDPTSSCNPQLCRRWLQAKAPLRTSVPFSGSGAGDLRA